MRILFATDFHYHIPYFTWLAKAAPRFDLTVYGGDFLDVQPGRPSAVKQIRWCQEWLQKFPGEIICAEGNHDAEDRFDLPKSEAGWLHNLHFPHVLTNGVHNIGGHQIEIMPWGDEPIAELEETGSIWVSHCPPRGSQCAITPEGVDFGDLSLGESVDHSFGPWLFLSGHVHTCRSWHDRRGVTSIMNPQVGYPLGVLPNHIIIETESRRATWHSGWLTEIVGLH